MHEDEHAMITEDAPGNFFVSCICGWSWPKSFTSMEDAEVEFAVHVKLRQYWLDQARKLARRRANGRGN